MTEFWFNEKNGRKYKISYHKDLFNRWFLFVSWCGEKRSGGSKYYSFNNLADLLVKYREIEKRRIRNGYKKKHSFP